MRASEIISYFASKNMGSTMLDLVSVVWEKLDEIEKQMIVSLYHSKLYTTFNLKSALQQKELDKAIQQTPYILL